MIPRRVWILSWLVACLVTSAPTRAEVAAAYAAPAHTRDAPVSRLRRMLDVNWREDPLQRQRLHRQLVHSGEFVVPAFFSILSGNSHTSDDPLAPPPEPLDRATEQLLFEALADMPARHVAEQLREQIDDETVLGERLLVMRILGRVGDSESLPVVLEAALGIERIELYRPRVRTAFETALDSTLTRDPRGFRVVEAKLLDIEEPLDESVVRALGRTGRAEALPLLQEMLFRRDELDAIVLEAVGRLDPRSLIVCRDEAVSLAQPFLGSTNPAVQARAADTLARLSDMQSFEEFVFLLESENGMLVHVAARSLQELTGLRLGTEPQRWMRWYSSEKTWLASRSRAAAISVDSHDVGDACDALRELSDHSAFRDELLWDVIVGLEHSDPAVVSAACTALERLDSPLAIPYLAEMLGDPRPGVDRALGKALRAIAGQPLPDKASAWLDWLDG